MSLLPCPYCWHGEVRPIKVDLVSVKWQCRCAKCMARGPSESTRKAAVYEWNRVAERCQP